MRRRLQGERTIDDVVTRIVQSLRQAAIARERCISSGLREGFKATILLIGAFQRCSCSYINQF